MPEFLFKHPDKEEYKEVFFKMNDDKKYVDDEGVEWKRRWHIPNASVDSISNTNPFDIQSHVDKTGRRKGTMDDLFNISKEMSERRAEKLGHEDPVKKKFFENYAKKNNGAKHFHDKPDKIETKHATIDFTAKSPDIEL